MCLQKYYHNLYFENQEFYWLTQTQNYAQLKSKELIYKMEYIDIFLRQNLIHL